MHNRVVFQENTLFIYFTIEISISESHNPYQGSTEIGRSLDYYFNNVASRMYHCDNEIQLKDRKVGLYSHDENR